MACAVGPEVDQVNRVLDYFGTETVELFLGDESTPVPAVQHLVLPIELIPNFLFM